MWHIEMLNNGPIQYGITNHYANTFRQYNQVFSLKTPEAETGIGPIAPGGLCFLFRF